MRALITSPMFAVAITVIIYSAAQKLYERWRFFLLNPVLISIAAIIALLKLLGLDYRTYNEGGRIISFFLGPAVVALGVLLHEHWQTVRAHWLALGGSILAASVVGIVSAAGAALALGASPEAAATIAPKSVTTPIAMGIAQQLGGMEPLTAALVVSAGVLGAVLGPPFLKLIGVRDPLAFGLAMGAAAHGIGTARALQEGSLPGAAGSLAICLNGLATAILAPPIMWLLRSMAG
jgi:predicted murein hydrolase (TIGR00659 family)